MGFYETLSAYYDEIFPARDKELSRVKAMLPPHGTLLDIGCGNGNKTILLADAMRETIGIDSDAAMIRTAAATYGAPSVSYRVADMLGIEAAFPADRFTAAVCLGNTLAHLPDANALADFYRQTAGVVAKNGVLVVQLLNYDRILGQHVDSLPRIESDNVIFERRYVWDSAGMHFCTTLTVKKTGERFDNDIILSPFRSEEITLAMAAHGWITVERLGNYAGETYAPESSFHLIIAARLKK